VGGGRAGDLYIFVSLASHELFQRDGADLHCLVPISMVLATLGGEFEVPTIGGGKTSVKVPQGAQSGSRFRLQGKGMPTLSSRQSGDMYVQVVIETPQKLTKRQRELLNEFRNSSSKNTNPESAGFFDKVRELLGGLAGSS
jgi:molecular chaperone DnaJ